MTALSAKFFLAYIVLEGEESLFHSLWVVRIVLDFETSNIGMGDGEIYVMLGALFWIGILFLESAGYFSGCSLGAPSAPIITGIALASIFRIFFSLLFNP